MLFYFFYLIIAFIFFFIINIFLDNILIIIFFVFSFGIIVTSMSPFSMLRWKLSAPIIW